MAISIEPGGFGMTCSMITAEAFLLPVPEVEDAVFLVVVSFSSTMTGRRKRGRGKEDSVPRVPAPWCPTVVLRAHRPTSKVIEFSLCPS